MDKKLSPKVRRFIAEFLKDQNGTQAAIRAGYSVKTAQEQASRLLSKVIVKAAVEESLRSVEAKALVNAEYVLRALKEICERCMQRVPVMVRRGHELLQATHPETGVGMWEFDSAGANRSLELLGKHLKLFTDKTEHSMDADLYRLLATQANEGR